MRKEFFYSMLAIGGAFPVTVNAAIVNADTPAANDWKDATVQNGVITVANGETSATVKLAKGKYSMSVNVASLTNDVTVSIDGADGYAKDGLGNSIRSQQLAAPGQAVIDFTLDDERTITIALRGQGQFTFSNVAVSLDFDFAAKVADLEKNYNAAVAVIKGYQYNNSDAYGYTGGDKNTDLLSWNTQIGVEINKIKEAGAADGYKIYVDNKLWEESPASLQTIQTNIDNMAQQALNKEVAYQTLVLQAVYDDIKKTYESLSSYAKAEADKKSVNMTSVQNAINAFAAGSSVDTTSVMAQLNTLRKNVNDAKTLDGGNDGAYYLVVDKINEATKTFTEQNQAIQDVTPYESYTKVDAEEKIDVYANVRAEAVKAITKFFDQIKDVTSKNEASHAAGTSVADRDGYITTLEDIIASIKATAAQYITHAATVKAVVEEITADYNVYLERTKAIENQIKADKDVAADATSALNAIKALETKMLENNTTINDKIKKLEDITSDKNAISTALNKLLQGDPTAINLNNYDAFKDMSDTLEGLESQRESAVSTVNSYVTGTLALTDYTPDTYWANTISFLQYSTTGKYGMDLVNKAYKEKKAVTFKSGSTTYSVDGTQRKYDPTAVKTAIETYTTNAKNAAKRYADVKAKAEEYQKSLDELKAKVEILDIYNNVAPGEVETYSAKIARVQTKINALNTKLNNAKNQKATTSSSYNEQHWTWVNANLNDDASIATDIAAIEGSYENAQNAWEKDNVLNTIEALQTAIAEKQAQVKTDSAYIAALTYSADDRADIVDKQLKNIMDAVPTQKEIDDAANKDKAELHNKALDDISKRFDEAIKKLDELKQKAIKAHNNFETYNSLMATANTIQAAIDKANADAQTMVEDLKFAYTVLTALYQKELDNIIAEIESSYKKGAAYDEKAELTEKLRALKAKTDRVASDALDDYNAYSKQLQDIEEAYKTWNEVYTDISKSDESSQLPVYQEELTKQLEILKDLEKEVEEARSLGQSAESGLREKIQDVITEILKIQNQSRTGYNAAIQADNERMNALIKDAVNDAKKSYAKAAESVKSFKDAESDLLRNALQAVEDETNVLSQAVKEFPTQIADLEDKAGKAFRAPENQSPNVFDKDSLFIFEARDIKAAIEEKEKAFLAAIDKAIEQDLGSIVANYNGNVTNAKATLDSFRKYYGSNGTTSTTASAWITERNNKFNDVNQLIIAIVAAKEARDINDLDKALMAAADAGNGVAASINTICNDYANEVLEPKLTNVENNKEWLTSDEQNILAALKNTYDAYKNSKLLDDYFETLRTQIADLQKKIDDAKAADVAYKNMIANLANVQGDVLTNAYAEADKYVVGSEIRQILDNLKAQLVPIAEAAKTALEDGTTSALNSQINNIKSQISTAINATTWDKEWAYLDGQSIPELEAQYVLFAADFTKEEQAAAYKQQIDKLKAKLNDTEDNNKSAHTAFDNQNGHYVWSQNNSGTWYTSSSKTPSFLLPYQAEIAKLLSDLRAGTEDEADFYKNINNVALAALNAAVAELEADANLNDFDEKVQEELSADLQDVKDEIANLKALIETNKDNIAYFQDDYNAYVEAIKAQIATLKANAQTAQENLILARQNAKAAYENAVQLLASVQELIDECKNEIDTFTYTRSSDYNTKFSMVNQQVVEVTIDEPVANASQKEAEQYTNDINAQIIAIEELKADVQKTLLDVRNTAANRELRGMLANLTAQVEEYKTLDEESYTIHDWKEIQIAISSIKQEIEDLGVSVDAAKQAETSYEGLNGELKKKVDEIQDSIDALNKKLGLDNLDTNADINGDGKISVADYTLLLNAVLDSSEDSLYDLNKDGEVDVTDIVLWVDEYRGNTSANTRTSVNAGDMADKVTVDVVGTNDEGVTRLAISLNSADNYRALQFDMSDTHFVAASLSERATGMGLYSRTSDNGTTRIVVCSMFGKEIASGEGAVVYVDVRGYSDATLANLALVNGAGQLVSFDLATGNASAIDGVAVQGSVKQMVYNAAGRLMSGLKKGLNIIVGNNGSTKKMVVK